MGSALEELISAVIEASRPPQTANVIFPGRLADLSAWLTTKDDDAIKEPRDPSDEM